MTKEPERRQEQDTGPTPYGQFFKHSPIAARVPEKVSCGVFCTGTMILQTSDEFIIDFLLTMVPPQQVVTRIIMAPATFAQMITALDSNIGKYEQQFGRLDTREGTPSATAQLIEGTAEVIAQQGGRPSTCTTGDAGRQASDGPAQPHAPIEDIYEQLKLPEELLGGVFANVVMIRHTAEEFCIDFIANIYPRSIVTNRVFFAAGRARPLLEALSNALKLYQQRSGGPSA